MLLAIPIGFVYVVTITFVGEMLFTLVRLCFKPCKCNIKCLKQFEGKPWHFFNIDSLITLVSWTSSLYLWYIMHEIPYNKELLLSAWHLATALSFMFTCDLSTVFITLCKCQKLNTLTMREKYYIQSTIQQQQNYVANIQSIA